MHVHVQVHVPLRDGKETAGQMSDSDRPVHPVTARINSVLDPFRDAQGVVKSRQVTRAMNAWAAQQFPDDEETRKQHMVSTTYLRQLLAGERTNPTIARLRTIAAVAGVPVQTLIPGDDTLTEFHKLIDDFRARQAQEDPGVVNIMARVRSMTPTQVATLEALMGWTRPPGPATGPGGDKGDEGTVDLDEGDLDDDDGLDDEDDDVAGHGRS